MAEEVEQIANGHDTEMAPEAVVDPALSELQEKYDRLASLEQYVNALGGSDKLIELATVGHQVRSNPEVQRLIQDALSGKRAEPESEREPEQLEIYDPEVKALNEKFDPVVKQLREQNAALEERLLRSETNEYKKAVTANIATVLDKFKDDADLFKEASLQLNQAMNQSSSQQLEMLSKEGGVKTLKMMLFDQHEKLYEKRLAQKPAQSPESAALLKATDARSQTRSALPANTVTVKSGVKVTPQMTREIMEQVTAQFGKDPKSYWN